MHKQLNYNVPVFVTYVNVLSKLKQMTNFLSVILAVGDFYLNKAVILNIG